MEQTYKLELEITSPDLVTVDEKYEVIYKIINNGDGNFPGGKVLCRLTWSNIENDTYVNHPLEIRSLPPGTIEEFSFDQIDRIPGMTYITLLQSKEISEDNFHFNIYDAKNSNRIPPNQVIKALRVRSMEEVLQKQMIKALSDSSITQDRLARAEVFLGAVAAIGTLIQIALALLGK